MKIKSPDKLDSAASIIAADCLAMRVRYMNRTLTSIYDDAFRGLGITASQVNMLVAIIKQKELSAGQLGDILNIEKSTLSRNLDRMRKAGWIEITPPPSGRSHIIQASKKGKELLLEVLPCWQEAQEDATQLLGPTGSRALKKAGNHAKGKS